LSKNSTKENKKIKEKKKIITNRRHKITKEKIMCTHIESATNIKKKRDAQIQTFLSDKYAFTNFKSIMECKCHITHMKKKIKN